MAGQSVSYKKSEHHGILLSVSLLGWSSNSSLSISDISSDWLMRRARSCLRPPSDVVSPGCAQLQSRKARTQKTIAKIALHKKLPFIVSPS
jgi:hypothetical protein